MSYIRKCDKCEQMQESKFDNFKDIKEIMVYSCEKGAFPAPIKTFHLCNDCYNKFISSLHKTK